MNPPQLFDIVFFHYPCQDGLASAWIANLFHSNLYKNIELYPIQHGSPIDMEKIEGKKVLFCDYAPEISILEQIEEKAKLIQILDHHKTAEDILKNKSYATFDMKKSGVGLSWDYFFGDLELPQFLEMIQDRDLWTWKIENSREFTSGLFALCDTCFPYDFEKLFEIFNNIYNDINKFNECITLGTIMNKINLNKATNIAKLSIKRIDTYEGFKVCIVNCPSQYSSDVGNILSSNENVDFAVLWNYNHPKEEYYVSLRSCNKVDVSQIAKKYGGGGHANASGFSTKINPTELFIKNEKIDYNLILYSGIILLPALSILISYFTNIFF